MPPPLCASAVQFSLLGALSLIHPLSLASELLLILQDPGHKRPPPGSLPSVLCQPCAAPNLAGPALNLPA